MESAKEEESLSKYEVFCIISIIGYYSDPYLRIMMFTQSGRLVKKKKTTAKIATKDPVFNETLNFEVLFQFII